MVTTTQKHNTTTYQCPICKLHYKDKTLAEQCEAWCQEHHSCNTNLIKHAVNK